MTSATAQAWEQFDEIVARIPDSNPWQFAVEGHARFVPCFEGLQELLAVPIEMGLSTQTGLPAKAIDVWVASELRRAGFTADEVWPRSSVPRVLPVEVAELISALPADLGRQVRERVESGKVRGNVASSDAKVLGKAYRKQVDVVIARWSRGAELMVSTKRMDSSFGKNALNRIEESYGDAKNLRARHPLAAIGYLLAIRSTAFSTARDVTERLIDLLISIAQEHDSYDACGLVVVDWEDTRTEAAPVRIGLPDADVPEELRLGAFMKTMVEAVLSRSPIDLHVEARQRRLGTTLAVAEAIEDG